MNASTHNLITLVFACIVAIGCSKIDDSVINTGDELPLRIDAGHLPNAIRIHERVISGGQPDGEAAFEELRSLGVRTIISVDGAKPDVVLAARHGMRYVHLPHGYNGIPDELGVQLAKAVRDFEGPIYIHCHHGRHRSPTAAAVACVANGMLEPLAATQLLRFAGTSENYLGLYQSAASARRLDSRLLDSLEADFPEVAELPPFAEAMVALEHTHDHLKRFAAAGWDTLDDRLDLDPAHEGLVLMEHFAELLRMESVAREPDEFHLMLERSETDARKLETLLRDRMTSKAVSIPEIDRAFKLLSDSCTACHQQFRDVPLSP